MKEKKGTCIKNEIIFLAPAIICFSCIVLIPFIYSFATSLTKWNGISKNIQWNGIANYKKILSDKAFLNSFIYTLKNMFVVTVIANALGLLFATVYKGNIIKNLIMDCQSYTKYRPNETTGGIFVSWRRKEELPTGA